MRTVGWRSPLGGPRYDGEIPGDRVDEWPQERIDAELEEIDRAKAVAGPENEARTDGGEDNAHASRVAQQLAIADGEGEELPALHVGDHVTPEGRDATTVVVRMCSESAGEYDLGFDNLTVAEYNGVPESEDVYEITFPERTTKDVKTLKRYAYPRSKLEVAEPVHDRDDWETDAEVGSVLERVFEQTVMNGNRSATEAEWLAEVLENEFDGDVVEEALEVAEAGRFGSDDGGDE